MVAFICAEFLWNCVEFKKRLGHPINELTSEDNPFQLLEKISLGLNLNSEHHLLNIPMAHCYNNNNISKKNIIPSFILNVFGVLIKILSMAKIIIKNDSEMNNVL